ncbi:Transmembrane protein, partial [Globisporangium splendens]
MEALCRVLPASVDRLICSHERVASDCSNFVPPRQNWTGSKQASHNKATKPRISAAVSSAVRFPLKKLVSVCCFVVAFFEGARTLADTITADDAQAWRLTNEGYDWYQAEPNAQIKIVEKGVADADGNLYFVGSKIGMKTRQRCTSPENALSYLAVDGQRAKTWDSVVVQGNHAGSLGGNNQSVEPGSTRTELEMDPWWEVDLGSVKPISSVVLYPFIGENGRNFCRSGSVDQFPAWSGDLYSYSRTDRLLMLEVPFAQNLEVLISDTSIATASDPATVAVNKKTTLAFSCENETASIAWTDVFTKGRFVTVRKHGLGVLMLNEVEVYEWNPGSTARYLLLDFYGVGDKPMALSSIQLFPPTDVTASAPPTGGYALPIPFNIHSVSSQLAATGSGSALALTSVVNSDCYIAAKTSFHEWVVLDLIKPTKVGLIEFGTNVDKCGSNVAPIHSISIAGYGSALDGMRSDNASRKLAAYSTDTCEVDSMGIVESSVALPSCKQFVCGEEYCNSQRTAAGSSSTLVLSDFCDLVLFGVVELFPLVRLPLSQNEHRALLLRDNPVALWAFDDQPKLPIASGVVGAAKGRATGVLAFSSVDATKQFLIDDSKEDTFFSNAVLVQAAIPAFSLEFWLCFTQDPKVSADSMPVNIVALDSGNVAFASVGISSTAVMDRDLPSPSIAIYYHVVASYDPSSEIISLTVRYSRAHGHTMTLVSAQSTCSLAMFSISKKTLNFGAYKASTGVAKVGFVGAISNVAWYVRALGRSEMLDHYHDFLWGVANVKTPSHNSYSLRLTSKPRNPVLIDVNAESLCYRFNLCNVTVTPSALVILPENWMELRTIHAVATDDQLYEGAHVTQITHEASSEPAYQLESSATTIDLFASGIEDSTIDLMTEYERLISEFYKEYQVFRVLEDPEVLHLREDTLAELRAMWCSQQIESNVLVNEPYNENLKIDPLTIDLIDLTIPGIEFSTSSLVVSEDGKGNDYQVMILSEPKGVVEIPISVDAECYRKCVEVPLCPSQVRIEEGGDLLACGDENTPTKLCNITISPDKLYFTGSNWKSPQTVRVVAVDDQLDEADVHLTSIKSTSKSVDPVYDNLFLSNIVVAVADNDETDVLYSTKYVTLSEKDSGSTRLAHNYSVENMYALRLATEPWANVTIAMSNEANHSCYRPCGYHFDNVSCGLPRQQSVSSIRLSTNSTREIHQISLSIPKAIEVQRIVAYPEHVDQKYRLELTGGFAEEIQVVAFQFDEAFKLRFKSADAIKNAVTYGRTFRIGASDRSASTVALDGFSSTATVEAALQTLFKQTQQAFRVTRSVLCNQSSLNWEITFTRLLRENGTFPLPSVTLDTAFEGSLSVDRSSVSASPSGSFLLRYGAADTAVTVVPGLAKAADLEGALRDLDAVFTVSVARTMHKSAYGFEYTITFANVDAYYSLQVNASTLVAASKPGTAVSLNVTQTQAPVVINGMFQVQYAMTVDLKITINASLVTQEIVPLKVVTEYDLDGLPRCAAIPTARFESDRSDPFGLRGWFVYDITNVTTQECFLCNYTVENPWIVFTPENWCIPQQVRLTSVDDYIDEQAIENGNVTFSNVTHTVFSDDMIYSKLDLDPVHVEVESDDFAEVLVSETCLECIFTPGDWDIAQTVVVLATDDELDECDSHATGISHISYNDDIKYHEIAIPKINVTVYDNDVSAFKVLKTSVAVTEGGAYDEYEIVLGSEPFAKVTVEIANIGAVGNLAIASPTRLLFTWKDWNVSQTVRVDTLDDFTEDPKDSSSVMVHTIRSNDVNYANLKDLGRVNVLITDNDVSGISLSTNNLNVSESNTTICTYGVRLNSEPWQPVVLSPNAKHGCYVRVVTSETLCNATILSPKLYFGAGNWSKWQNVSLLAFDDWLTESPVHRALITHSSASKYPLYQVANYSKKNGKVMLWITDNDFPYVNISLQAAGERNRAQLHVAEGGFNDSYRIVLDAEPYEDVQLLLKPALEEFANLETKAIVRVAQVGAVYGTSSSIATSPGSVRAIEIVFTALDWFQPRVIQVFAIDDKIAEDPTQYSSILHEVASADANYNINSSIGVTAVSVMVNDKESIPPPIPILAIFDASGSKLQVAFDSSVYRADTMSVRNAQTSGSVDDSSLYLIKRRQFPCNLVFNFTAAKYSLGSGAVCLWLDLKNLRIELGSGATITAKDVLSLNDCSAFANQYCQPVLPIYECSVQVPSDIAKHKVIFISPDDATSCGSWPVDASLSQGAGGHWKSGSSSSIFVPTSDLTANPDLASVSTMAQLRSACYMRSVAQTATKSKSLKIQINSTLIEPGVEYVVGLELVNAFAQRTTMTKAIQIRSLPGPTVFVIGGANLEVTRVGDPIVPQVDSTISCMEMIGTQAGYKWSVSSAAFNESVYTPVDFSSKNTAKDPRVFRIPRTALDAETSHRFQIEAYMKNTTKVSSNSSAVISINVTTSALIASITGGNRALGERDMLVLNANMSSDPDLSSMPFTYTWSCADITNASLPQPQPCVNASASTSVKPNVLDLSKSAGALLSIAPFSIQMNRKLRFSLAVAKASSGSGKPSRNTSTSTTTWSLPGNLPDVEISTSVAKINPSNRVVLSAQVRSAYPYTSQWIQLQGDLDLPGAWEVNGTTHNDAFGLPLASLNNVILKDKLTHGMTYIFRLIATDINGNQGFGSTSVTVNSPPSSGRFEVTPKSGYAIEDEFLLFCAEWTDGAEDMPLKYSFGVMSTSLFDALVTTTNDTTQLGALLRTKSVPLVSDQLIPMVSVTMLPPAELKDNETTTIIAFVSDNLGSFAYATESIEVLLPSTVKSDPLSFVRNLVSNDSVTATADASQKRGLLLSAASILDGAFKAGLTGASPCTQTGSGTIVCSGRGSCESTTLTCVCQDGYLGLGCEFETSAVQSVNSELLANLESAPTAVEPTVSALSQQAVIVDTVLQASPSAFDEDRLSQATSLSSSIVDNAFLLQDPSAFIDTAGATVMSLLSTVVSIASDGESSTYSDNDASVSRSRRLALSTAIDCSHNQAESAQVSATYNQLLSTLNSLTAVASQDALSEEDAIGILSGQIQVFAAAGTMLKAPNSALSVSITDPAIACLEPDLFLSALVLSTSTHSRCKLGNSHQISANTAILVHSKAAVQAAGYGPSSAPQAQKLLSTSLCVVQAAAKSATAAKAQSRLASNEASSGETTLWHPLIVLSIPRSRALSAIELRNFSTTCQVWNAQRSAWDADVCFYDETTSTSETTVCYCNEIGRLEVVVTLEERLDFQALYKDLYRNEPASIVPSVVAAILFSLFIVGTKIGQRMDSSDEKKQKEKTIKNLNRAKWGELHERTQSNAVLEDFSTFHQRKKLELQTSAVEEQNLATGTIDHLILTDADQETRIAEAVTPMTQIDPHLVLPNEVATLFGATKNVETQYLRVLGVFRFCNALLVVFGVILAFTGVDFYLVLGNSTSELLLYVYGNALGLVVAAFGGTIVSAGLFGLMVSRKQSSHLSRNTYVSLVLLLLIAQIVFVAIAYRYLEDFKMMPSALRYGLSRVWDALPDGTKEQIEVYYGCCGFASVKESSACPEEALDALPPRTCSRVLAIEAQELFTHSFAYIEVLLLVEVLCITVANMLVKWCHLRLLELAGEPASSVTGETSAKRAMLHSQVNVALLCTLPSLYYVLVCALVFAVLCGLDMALQANYISSALIAALYGMEVGIALVVASGVYLLILMRGIHAVAYRDIRGLQWFVVLSLGFLIVSAGISQFLVGIKRNLLLDPVIMQTKETRFLALSRRTLVNLEVAMECCGFDATSEGTCILSGSSTGEPIIRTCRATVEHILGSSIAVLTTRVTILVLAEAVVFVLSTILMVRLRRFATEASINPIDMQSAVEVEVDEYQTSWNVFVHNACFFVLVLLNFIVGVLGLILVWAGVDVLYRLNVLHMAYLLQSVSDKQLGVYLVALGSGLVLFAVAGFGLAWKRSKKLFFIYGVAGLALFVAIFGVLGLSFRLSHHAASYTSSDAMAFPLGDARKAAPSATKMFVQNAFTCCGYAKIEASNGTVTYTDMAEAPYWMQVHETTSVGTYSRSRRLSESRGETKVVTTRRELTETQTQVKTQPLCPETADSGSVSRCWCYCVRKYHQGEQNAAAAAAESLAAEKAIDAEKAKALLKEEFVSSSTRFGPRADPQPKILVKRQHLLRELKEKRDSLSYKLMSKVGKLPPLLSRGSSKLLISKSAPTTSDDGVEDKALAGQKDRLDHDSNGIDSVEEAPPTGAYVILQNRKLSPKKRALEMVLKKKSREEKGKRRDDAASGGSMAKSPSKKAQSPTQRAKAMFQNWKAPSPRKSLPAESTLLLNSPIAIVEEEEVEETASNFKTTETVSFVAKESQVAPLEGGSPKANSFQAQTHESERTKALQISIADNALRAAEFTSTPLVADSSTTSSVDHAPAEEAKGSARNREVTIEVPASQSGNSISPPMLHRTAGIEQNEARSEEKEDSRELVAAALDEEAKADELIAPFDQTELIEHDSRAETKLTVDRRAVDEAKTHADTKDDHKVVVGHNDDDEDKIGDDATTQKEDEPKPFGAYMLLNKQAPSAGKSKILDNILQKKNKLKSPRSRSNGETEVAQPKDEAASESRTAVAMPTSSQSSIADTGEEVMSQVRPHTSGKKTATTKSTSLEQALKKSLAKGGGRRGGSNNGSGKPSRLRTPSTPPSKQ